MTAARLRMFVVCLCLVAPKLGNAYNVGTHQLLTTRAVTASVLPDRLGDLGLSSLTQLVDDYTVSGTLGVIEFCIPRALPNQRTVVETITLGAFCEDSTFGDSQSFRYLNHFYDPYHQGQGLEFPVGSGIRADSSLAWGLNANNHARQIFAYSNVRDYLEQSFIGATVLDRKTARASFLRGLGQLMHLVQDIGQPQHTREDPHGGGSGFEIRVDRLIRKPTFVLAGYPNVQVAQWSDLWSTQNGTGLADFTNSQFVTEGRNFRGTPQGILGNDYEPSPTGAGAQVGSPVDASSLDCMTDSFGNPGTGKVTFVSLPVQDKYSNSSVTIGRATSLSILSSDLQTVTPPFAGRGAFAMNDCNFDDHQVVLLPAAVGYSAGLIDYVMRGQMEINLPDAGFYGIVDHSQFSGTDAAQGFQGFSKIKIRLKNLSQDLTPPGVAAISQAMSSGTLRAVLSFHRNLCYDDLLSNWPTTSTQALPCRSASEEIVVSTPQTRGVPFSNANAPNGDEITFQFPQSLPINAWDVVLHVLYRGTLGTEDDVVVVATKDISEPTFVTFTNTTDYVVLNGTFMMPSAVSQDQLANQVTPGCRAGQPGNYSVSQLCFNVLDNFVFTAGAGNVSITAGGSTAVAPRRLARIALLADAASPATFGWQTGAVSCWKFLSDPLPLPSYRAQADELGNLTYYLPSVIRGVKVWDGQYCYSDIGITQTLPTSLNVTQLDNLQSPGETTPTAVSITGW